jgi:hypothetical protein
MPSVKLGALCWNQYSDWPSHLDAVDRADRLGYDSLGPGTSSSRASVPYSRPNGTWMHRK